MTMVVTCPNCKEVFAIEQHHLKAANGEVRCGRCQTVFNASEQVRDQKDQPFTPVN